MSEAQQKHEPLQICIEIEGFDRLDMVGLRLGIEAMERTSERMRKATLEYLWDRYVTHGVDGES